MRVNFDRVREKVWILSSILLLVSCNQKDITAPPESVVPSEEVKQLEFGVAENEFSKHISVDAPQIMVATQANQPPFEFLDRDGKFVGFDIDIVHAIAADQGMRVHMVNTSWKTIFLGLDNKDYDIVIGGMGPNEERQSKYALTDSYARIPNIAVMLETSSINQLSDLNGKKISVFDIESADQGLKAHKVSAGALKATSSAYMMLRDVVSGETDAAIADKFLILYHAKNMPDYKFRYIEIPSSPDNEIVIMASHDRELAKKMNVGLANIKENGIYDAIIQKWFGE